MTLMMKYAWVDILVFRCR